MSTSEHRVKYQPCSIPNGEVEVRPVVTEQDRDRLRPFLDHGAAQAVYRLRQLLASARIVPPARVPPDVITMNSHLSIRDPRDGSIESYMLAYPDHDDGDGFALSVLSPMGAALLAAAEGDHVTFPGARGMRSVRIESLIYQPERAGDHDL